MIIGIDLGTTNSVVAYFTEEGDTETIDNDQGNEKTPSVVMIEDDDGEENVTVGDTAERKRTLDPERVLARTKQDIDKDELPTYDIGGTEYDAIDAGAYVLDYLKTQAEQKLDQPVEGAVITVPYDFTNKGRARTEDAGEIAGLDVKQVINEPTAASLSYVHENDITGTLLVYDLGGGTFDATLVDIGTTVINVIGTEGDGELGGEDFDDALYDLVREKIEGTDAPDPEDANPKVRAGLRRDVKELKHNLSDLNEDFIVYEGEEIEVSRAEFEDVVEGMVDTTFEKIETLFEKDVVTDEGIGRDDVDHVLLVGGSTRVPLVQERVEEFFGRDPKLNVDPDTVVARGGAIQAAEYRDEIPPEKLPAHTITNVLSHNVGVQLNDGTFDELLAESENVPTSNTDDYTNPTDNVTKIEVPVWEKGTQDEVLEDAEETDEERIGDLLLEDLPRADAGELDIEVTFVANPDGTLHVEAHEEQSDQTVETTIDGLGLSEEEKGDRGTRLGLADDEDDDETTSTTRPDQTDD
jgi:molecular chaperone DnaK